MRKLFAGATLYALTGILALVVMAKPADAITAPDGTQIICLTNTTSPEARPGDDSCTLETGVAIWLDGSDTRFPDANITKNDVPPGTDPVCVTWVSNIDSAVATVSYSEYGIAIYVTPGAKPFQFDYLDCLNGNHNVAVTPHDTPTPVKPTVTKLHRKGMLKVCEPSAKKRGGDIVMAYGSFKQESADGVITVYAGTCKKIKVKRHKIDYIVVSAFKAEMMVEHGIVRGIKLPKKTKATMLGARRSFPQW